MATYVLIPGAGGEAWYWHRVVPALRARGHEVVAPDLPAGDEEAGVPEYVAAVEAAIDGRGESGGGARGEDLIVVAQSMGAFTAVQLCLRRPVALLVLVAAMLPAPGETMGQWWADPRWRAAKAESDARLGLSGEVFDAKALFFHDVPEEVVAEAWARGEPEQTDTPFGSVGIEEWPAVATRFLLCREDRFLPAGFQRQVVRERLGIEADEMGGGHLPALGRPEELVGWLERFRVEAGI